MKHQDAMNCRNGIVENKKFRNLSSVVGTEDGDSDSTDSDSDQGNQQPADILDTFDSDDTVGDPDYSDSSKGESSKK
ncbi:hypothetical protein JTB14_029068 [Gonioctena quinquepunctata]|nr:hypothetical protein JTB14_029068 [Gonioctena quinquepunctata]